MKNSTETVQLFEAAGKLVNFKPNAENAGFDEMHDEMRSALTRPDLFCRLLHAN